MCEITSHGDPFVKGDPEWIQAGDRMYQAVDDAGLRLFLCERAEEPVPDDQDPAVVAVQIFLVRGVMHAVV